MAAEIDRLIERGLQLYGNGDVDGALGAWERALAIDPDDARAAAYVDYVRENYEMLQQAPRPAEDEVPFGLGDGIGLDDYEIEITRPGAEGKPETSAVERYIEAVDEGWFLDDEPGGASAFDAAAQLEGIAPPGGGRPVRDDDFDLGAPLELDDPRGEPARPSLRQLPLPAEDSMTLEIEAEEPDPLELDERTGDWGRGALALEGGVVGDLDFSDQRSAVPTQEIAKPRGFVQPRLEPVARPTLRGLGPLVEPDEPGAAGGDDDDDDRLRTRPGRGTGPSPLDRAGEPDRVSPEALQSLATDFGGVTGTGPGSGARPIGPDERTREQPAVRVTFNPDTQDLPYEAPEIEERTTERNSAGRFDTSSEPTTERAPGIRHTTPPPLAGPSEGPSSHPPLVIIEDPVLAGGMSDHRDEPTSEGLARRKRRTSESRRERARTADPARDELDPGTTRVRRGSGSIPSVTPLTAVDASPPEDLAERLDREVDEGAPEGEARGDRTRRRVNALIDRAVAASRTGDHATAIVALDLALAEDPESAVAQKLIHRHQPAILDVYQRFLGDLSARPSAALPMHELSAHKIDIRAAFLLSRIDGTLTFEEILDVSGMQRAEAFRHLSVLLLRGILAIR